MADSTSVILSGFADEASNQKKAEQQFCAFAAIGLQHFTLRFIDAATVKNVMLLDKQEIKSINELEPNTTNVSSIVLQS